MAYTIREGDTVTDLATRFGVTANEIMAFTDLFSTPGDSRTLKTGAIWDVDATVRHGANQPDLGEAPPRGGDEGTSSTSGSSFSGKDYNDADDAARFLGVPGMPQVWKNSTTGKSYLMYEAPGTQPPIPLLYEIKDEETLKAFFGSGTKVVYDKEFSSDEMNSTGAVNFGTTDNLEAADGDPWLGFLDRMERAAKVQPWLADDEVLSMFAVAHIEGRELQDWELEGTDWWQTHSEREREWLSISMADPETANRRMVDDQSFVRSLFEELGASGNDPEMLNWMSNKYTTGDWTEAYLKEQIEAVTSGWTDVDVELERYMLETGAIADTTLKNHENVRALWNEWLGPAYQPTDEEVENWATKLRKTGDAKEELTSMLRGQRLALYQNYEDPNLTYQDIAGPWRNQVSQVWGQVADEQTDFFQEIVRSNDYGEAQRMLRKEGMAQGIDKVWSDAVNSTGSSVRRAI